MRDSDLLELMITAALAAGRAAHEIFKGDLNLEHKKDNSPVTAADHAAEAIILRHLARAHAEVPIIAEEEVAAGRIPEVGHTFFLVDPLDGTREFIAGRDEFTVNIALVRAGAPALGVVYAPATGALFAANVAAAYVFQTTSNGHGIERSARTPIHVRSVPAAGLTVVASRSHPSPQTSAYLSDYPVAGIVSIGSSLKFCLLASGAADLYPRLGRTMEWDTAAGHAVLLSAGGRVVTGDGAPLLYGKPGFANPWFIASGAVAARPVSP